MRCPGHDRRGRRCDSGWRRRSRPPGGGPSGRARPPPSAPAPGGRPAALSRGPSLRASVGTRSGIDAKRRRYAGQAGMSRRQNVFAWMSAFSLKPLTRMNAPSHPARSPAIAPRRTRSTAMSPANGAHCATRGSRRTPGAEPSGDASGRRRAGRTCRSRCRLRAGVAPTAQAGLLEREDPGAHRACAASTARAAAGLTATAAPNATPFTPAPCERIGERGSEPEEQVAAA